jgi:hypothetical protein
MTHTYLTRRWGDSQDDPTDEQMREALNELDAADPEHPDCWLTDDSEWSIAAFESGLVVLESLADDGTWHLKGQSKEQVLELWRLLQAGDLPKIRSRNWLPGYGGSR